MSGVQLIDGAGVGIRARTAEGQFEQDPRVRLQVLVGPVAPGVGDGIGVMVGDRELVLGVIFDLEAGEAFAHRILRLVWELRAQRDRERMVEIPPAGARVCRVCGCADDHACEGGCFWVEWDLCSACVGQSVERVVNRHARSKAAAAIRRRRSGAA